MAHTLLSNLQNLWPISAFTFDDLKASDKLVRKLPIPGNTKQFVFAIRDPESQAVIYILCAQNLSERSASDAECLIREIRPDAVVLQLGQSDLIEIQGQRFESRDNIAEPVPTSALGVVIRCFVDKITKEKYENVAGNLVLREIFGIDFHGHLFAAKRAAQDVGSSLLLLDSPFVKSDGNQITEPEVGNKFQALVMQPSNLVPNKVGSTVSTSSKRFSLTNDLHLQMVRSLSSYLSSNLSPSGDASEAEPRSNYQAPSFAQSVYPLLADLHDIFVGIPLLRRALAHAQKILYDVDRGEVIETRLLSEVYSFRIAVEGLRIALNNYGRLPINKMGKPNSSKVDFSVLSVEEKSHVLLVQALKSQTEKFKSIVAIVDASGLAGLRKHWNTSVPIEVKDMVENLVTNCECDGEISNPTDRKRLLTGKPVVAVGAGATAVLGAASLSKVVPASTFVKIVKLPASIKLLMSQSHKAFTFAFGKSLGTTKATSVLKASASAEKIRAMAHSIIASAEKTSLSAMRTAFYEIMRKRRVQPIGVLPWATFGCSVAACTGLLAYGDGIECAVESLPSAPSMACLGRGIQSLHQASQALNQTDSNKIHCSMESVMSALKKANIQ